MLAKMSAVVTLADSDLCTLDDPADCLYLLTAGKIAVRKRTGFSNRMQVVALLDPGAPIGEGGLLPGGTRGATLTAVAESRLLMLSRQDFDEISATDPDLALKFMKWLLERTSQRLKKSSERLAHIL
jgi:CRP-like cAMP-binding protein